MDGADGCFLVFGEEAVGCGIICLSFFACKVRLLVVVVGATFSLSWVSLSVVALSALSATATSTSSSSSTGSWTDFSVLGC